MRSFTLIFLAVLLLQGCGFLNREQNKGDVLPVALLEKQLFIDLNGWSKDNHAEAFLAFLKTCSRIKNKKSDSLMKNNGVAGTYADWQSICLETKYVPKNDDVAAKRFFEHWFAPYLVRDKANKKTEGLFTGYYEPMLEGSWTQKGKYQTPLYTRPDDLVDVYLGEFRDKMSGERISGRIEGKRLIPYYNREEITDGALVKHGKPLLWVDNAVQAFFLHIQGSGRVTMEDGSEVGVGYDGQNGHIYYAIGRYLVDIGALTKQEVSLPSIRMWLLENSEEAENLMNKNKSYIFFRKLKTGSAPLGGSGVELTGERSLAVDHRIWAYGIPVWLDIDPVFSNDARIQKLMVAQDTGGAIRGSVRGDVFWGNGEKAEKYAGHMKSKGQYSVLLPKSVVLPENLVWSDETWVQKTLALFKYLKL